MRTSRSTCFISRLWRIIRLIGWLFTTIWVTFFIDPHNLRVRNLKLKEIAQKLLTILNVRLEVQHSPPSDNDITALVVANHVSWLDIFILLTQYPGGFIAKQSIRKWPFIGRLASQAGTIFINRDSRNAINPTNQAIEQTLKKGQRVIFFPEARTSDGLGLLPFKTALFQAAADTHTPVQSVALRYYDQSGKRTVQASYVGKTNLLVSIWRISGLQQILVKVDCAPLINTASVTAMDRSALKKAAEDFISAKVRLD